MKKIEQNITWGEDDENIICFLINITEGYRIRNGFSSELEKGNKAIDWLKSLKKRYTWKPSNEQIKVLEFVIELIDNMLQAIGHIDNVTKPRLKEILVALKKLRGE